MKKFALLFTALLFYSCMPTTVVTQNHNSLSPVTIYPSSTTSSLPDSQPTRSTPTPTPPNFPILYPTPTPSPFDNLYGKYIKSIGVYTDGFDFPISFRNTTDASLRTDGAYNILKGETKKFRVEMVLSDDSILKDTILWESSNPNTVSIDSDGIIRTGENYGTSYISIFAKNYPSVYLVFKVNYLESLNISELKDSNCNTIKIYVQKQRVETANFNTDNIDSVNKTSGNIAYDLATFNGKVYDTNNNPIEGAKVTAFSLEDKLNNWVGEPQITVGGAYVFRNAPVSCNKILITVSKEGYKTQRREVFLRANINDIDDNRFNFGGIKEYEKMYALEVVK